LKEGVAILPTGFEEILIYQLFARAKKCKPSDVVVLTVSQFKIKHYEKTNITDGRA